MVRVSLNRVEYDKFCLTGPVTLHGLAQEHKTTTDNNETYGFIVSDIHCVKCRNSPNFLVWKLKTMRKLCLSTKFLHQQIRLNYDIFPVTGVIVRLN